MTQELHDEMLLRFHFQLIALRKVEGEFGKESAEEIASRLDAMTRPQRFVWIGHDDKTGPLALELKSLVPGSHAVLINHMAHGAYQSVKKGNSLNAAEKQQHQLDLFRNADLCLAVGPMLRANLEDLLACVPKRPPVEMLVPGLADPTKYEVEIRDAPPGNYVAFIAGRLAKEGDRIKQGQLALRGFGRAVREAQDDSAIRNSPTLRMRGIGIGEEDSLRDALTQEAGRAVNFDFQEYTNDRTAYFRDLASSSVAMMPSWHEGFGLTAWEAIASEIPVVIGEESGVYRLLKAECSGAGLGQSVAPVPIDGWLASNEGEPNHTEDDVVRVSCALIRLAQRPIETKQQAARLRRSLLMLGFDWKGTALAFVSAIERQLRTRITAELLAVPFPSQMDEYRTSEGDSASERRNREPFGFGEHKETVAEESLPDWIRSPAPRAWQPGLGLPTSILLAARDAIVRFDPERETFLKQMLSWAARSNELSARLLSGPGGSGKTRLALELTRRLRNDGWRTLWLSPTHPTDWVDRWNELLTARREQPLLLVIDYADARPLDVLACLNSALENLRTSETLSPFRLLLLARSESWLGGLHTHPNCPQELAAWLSVPDAIEPLTIPPWTRDPTARLNSYQLALKDYAMAMGLPRPAKTYVPPLSKSVFDRPLYMHLAALAALDGQRPTTADALMGVRPRRYHTSGWYKGRHSVRAKNHRRSGQKESSQQ